ncbi:MAG TPA: OmpW family outer membrane protein [Thermoanaerobaculia bacterium]|nr:OmpW family outer membrane protein [Thermoanaerobaculia bacterium]
MNRSMNPIMNIVGGLGIVCILLMGSRAAAATGPSDPGWRLKLSGISAQPAGGLGFNSSAGFGLGLEYRVSRRLGVELAAMTTEMDSELSFEFFDSELFVVESSLRVTPVLAQLNLHLTPDHRADLYLGPVFGRIRYGDLDIEVHGDGGSVPVAHVRTKDGYAWGAHIGMDVPVGGRGVFLTAGATYLKAKVEPAGGAGSDDDPDESGPATFDLNPLVAQVGFGYRF